MPNWMKTADEVEHEAGARAERKRARELKAKLDATDHKTYNGYEPNPGEDVEAIIAERNEWRREVRELQAWLEEHAPEEDE